MQPEHYLIRHHFSDFDEFAHTARAWDLNIRQIERGGFEGDLFQFGTGDFQVAHAAFKPGTYQQGAPPNGFRTLCILSDPTSHLIWRRKTIAANAIMVFPIGAGLDAVSKGGRLKVFTLSFSDKLFVDIGQTVGFLDLDKLLNGQDVIVAKPQSIVEIRHFLYWICRELTKHPTKLDNHSIRYELEFELPRKLLLASSESHEKMPKRIFRMRDLALRRVEDYLKEFPNTPHTVRDLCRVAKVSERTLQYAFRERFGIPPKSFLLALRLNGVRQELKNTSTKPSTITDLATQWGFWHMSQFASDYRCLFGELPSETIRKKKIESRKV